MVVEVGVASFLNPLSKPYTVNEVGKVGVIQHLCEPRAGSTCEETREIRVRQKVRQIYLG